MTIYLTCSGSPSTCDDATGSGLTVGGNAQLTLAGGALGSGDGIALRIDPGRRTSILVSGSAQVAVTGSVDAPATSLTLSGAARVNLDNGILVTNTIAMGGSTHLDVDRTDLPATSYSYNGAGELTGVADGASTAAYT